MLPTAASSRLSVRSWRITRARPLPSASRSAISFRRAAPRASIMLVRLRHAMSSTSAGHAHEQRREHRQLRIVLRPGADARSRANRSTTISWSLFSTGSRPTKLRERPAIIGRAASTLETPAKPADQHQRVVLRVAQPAGAAVANHFVRHRRVDPERQPELRGHERDGAGKALRGDADDLVVARVEAHGSPEHVRGRNAGSPRETVSHDHDRAGRSRAAPRRP